MAVDSAEVPEVLEPPGGVPVRLPGQRESAPLWEGSVGLTMPDGGQASGDAVLRWEWLPEPELRLTVQSNERWRLDLPFEPVAIAAVGASLDLLAATRLGGPFSERVERVLLLSDARIGKVEAGVDAVLLQMLNVPRFLGLPVRRGGQSWAGRIGFDAGPWRVRIDGIPHAPDADDHRRAGYLVTHTMRIERADGARFTLPDVEPAVEALVWLLSVLRGEYVAAPAWHGLTAGEEVWSRHVACSVDAWAGERGAFPTGFVAAEDPMVLPALGRTVERLLTLRGDAVVRDALDRALLWLATANAGATPGDLVIAQAGLELLAYLALVPPGAMTAKGFERLTAADQIRLVLRHLDLPVEIPSQLPTLAAWAAGEHQTAAPEAVARFRNFTVHPPTRNRPVAATELDVVVEARTLALSLLEQILLAHAGYDALIRDRVQGWAMRPLR